jgi:tetratricopeptide (TPR) repeat protein
MYLFRIFITKTLCSIILFLFLIKVVFSDDNIIKEANALFDQGKYIESVDIASQSSSIESYIFRAKTLSIYGHFLLNGDEAINVFKKAKEYAESALEIDINNDEAHVEAAHAMGRHSQLIGVLSALKQGYAEKIEFHLDEAIKQNPKNVSAQIAKGTWNAEIVNKVGFMANFLYGAKPDLAREHYKKALNLDSKNIGIIYEIANGLVLLDEIQDLAYAKDLLLSALDIRAINHLEKMYLNKVQLLLEDL